MIDLDTIAEFVSIGKQLSETLGLELYSLTSHGQVFIGEFRSSERIVILSRDNDSWAVTAKGKTTRLPADSVSVQIVIFIFGNS